MAIPSGQGGGRSSRSCEVGEAVCVHRQACHGVASRAGQTTRSFGAKARAHDHTVVVGMGVVDRWTGVGCVLGMTWMLGVIGMRSMLIMVMGVVMGVGVVRGLWLAVGNFLARISGCMQTWCVGQGGSLLVAGHRHWRERGRRQIGRHRRRCKHGHGHRHERACPQFQGQQHQQHPNGPFAHEADHSENNFELCGEGLTAVVMGVGNSLNTGQNRLKRSLTSAMNRTMSRPMNSALTP